MNWESPGNRTPGSFWPRQTQTRTRYPPPPPPPGHIIKVESFRILACEGTQSETIVGGPPRGGGDGSCIL